MGEDPIVDEAAERAVLGAMVLDNREIPGVLELVTVDDFYRPAHQIIFSMILDLYTENIPADAITLQDRLNVEHNLTRIGGFAYILGILEECRSSTAASFYADIVAEKSTRRRLAEAGTRILQMANASTDETDEVVERARAELDKLVAPRASGDTMELGDLVAQSLRRLDEPEPTVVSTGLPELDDVLDGGLRPGTLTVFGARPSVGKSIVCLQIAKYVASLGIGSQLFSLEMSFADVMDRLLASEASVPLQAIRRHALSSEQWARVSEAAERINEWPLAVTDAPRIGLTGVTSRARDRMHTPRKLGLIVLDYIQIMSPPDARRPRHEQIGALSGGLRQLGRELSVPVVIAAQLNRASDQRPDKRPGLTDLRESGSLEQDADTVILLHDDPGKPNELEFIIAKNRQGQKRTITVAWQPNFARAVSL